MLWFPLSRLQGPSTTDNLTGSLPLGLYFRYPRRFRSALQTFSFFVRREDFDGVHGVMVARSINEVSGRRRSTR
jgi:hypothetical protein